MIDLIINILNSKIVHGIIAGISLCMVYEGIRDGDKYKIILFSVIGWIFLQSVFGLATVKLSNPFK
ncbi:hypothetical protein ETI10_10545 [Macrococcoides goetzii]|nr:hypothetical protein [Macrococcus goetzii]TDM39874.1 hypothetical protein ETI10_10545 [Macrococcus goetzii]